MDPISRSRTIAAPPDAIFDVLADPRRHPEIDGSDTVVEAKVDGPERLELGSKFGMKMKQGVPYRITNKVVEFKENELIAWCHPGGHRWRYELEGVDGGTKVTETFDPSTSKAKWVLKLMKVDQKHEPSIEKTLEKLDEVVTADKD